MRADLKREHTIKFPVIGTIELFNLSSSLVFYDNLIDLDAQLALQHPGPDADINHALKADPSEINKDLIKKKGRERRQGLRGYPLPPSNIYRCGEYAVVARD